MAIISLLSDFGSVDPYVGVMKGVILSLHPDALIVDLTHQVPPQDVRAGAFLLAQAVDHFPADAIHLAVVDPGVGTARRAIAVETEAGRFVGPDNGIFARVLAARRRVRAVELSVRGASATFHGRDVFAPAAAKWSRGAALAELGRPVRLARAASFGPRRRGGVTRGTILHVNRFGNLITNLTRADVAGAFEISAGSFRATRLGRTYADAKSGALVALVGSAGLLEIAARDGSAAAELGLVAGDAVVVRARR